MLHAPARLRLVTVLLAAPAGHPWAFAELQTRLGLTAGNLSTHLRKLEVAGYVAVEKVFRDRVPTTSVSLTETGRRAHAAYATAMTSYLDGSALGADDALTTTEATP